MNKREHHFNDMNFPVSNNLDSPAKVQARDFFVGPGKFTKNTKGTYIYSKPGSSPISTVKANDTIGKVIGVNSTGTWGQLENGNWIFLENSMYTVILTVEPPKSVGDAVGREAVNVVKFSVGQIFDFIPKWVVVAVVIGVILYVFVEVKAVTNIIRG